MKMSVGQSEPVSKGEMNQLVIPPPNQNIDTNHHRNNHDIHSNSNDIRYRTSFKSTKPKQSKIRHLTYSELRGILLATMLSFVISGMLLYSLFSLSPIAFRHGLNFLQLFSNYISNDNDNNDATMKQQQQQQQVKKVSRYMGVKKDINCSMFKEYYLQKYPVVFMSDNNRLDVHTKILDLLMNKDNADIAVELKLVEELLGYSQYFNLTDESSNAFVLTLNEYYRFELSMNDDIVDRNYYYSDMTLISNLIHRNISADRTTNILPPELLLSSSSFSSPSQIKCSSKDNIFKKFTNHIVSIGRNISHLSGMGFHIHKQRLNELLYGQKHWVFYKPVNIPSTGFHPQENLYDWLRDIYPSLTMNEVVQPIEILQNAGEIVYIPEGWYHATRTMSEVSISISYEPSEEEYGTYYYYLIQGNKKANGKDFKSAIKLYRLGLAIEADVNILQKLAYSYEQEGLLIDAEETYLQAIQRNPRDPYTYALLINLLITYNPKDATSNITDLLHRGETYGLKPSILKLMQTIL